MVHWKSKAVGGGGVPPPGSEPRIGRGADPKVAPSTVGEEPRVIGLDPTPAERSAATQVGVQTHTPKASPAFSLMASQMSRSRGDGPITVRAELPYPVTVRSGRRTLHFSVRFTEAAAAAFSSGGSKVDFSDGSLVSRDGSRQQIGDGAAFATERGEKAPPFVFLHPEGEQWVVPKGTLLIGVDGDGFLRIEARDTPVSERTQSLFFSTLRATADSGISPGSTDPLSPAEAQALFRSKLQISPKVGITGPSDGSVAKAKAAFDAVAGPAFRALEEKRGALEAEYDSLRDRTLELLEVKTQVKEGKAERSKLEELLREEQGKLGLPSDASVQDVAAVHAARRNEIRDRLKPVEIVVLPKGVHYSALPEFERIRGKVELSGILANVTTLTKRTIFLSEEELESGRQVLSRHELYHYVEDVLLEPERRREVDALHARYLASGGPFPRLYGIPRDEFLTVASEEFEGGWGGKGGPGWLKENMGEVYDFLKTVTGRDPAS